MGKINDSGLYPNKTPLTGNETVIGSDFDENGRTRQIPVNLIKDYVLTFVEDQNNLIPNAFLGIFDNKAQLSAILNSLNLQVNSTTIPSLSHLILTPLNSNESIYIQNTWLWRLGKGNYFPIGSANLSTKFLTLVSTYPTLQIVEEVLNNPDAVVNDYGEVTGNIVDIINNATPFVDFGDTTKVYYVRAIIDEVTYLWRFNGMFGNYGQGQMQVSTSDLVLLFNSALADTPYVATDVKRFFVELDQEGTSDPDVLEVINEFGEFTLERLSIGSYRLNFPNLNNPDEDNIFIVGVTNNTGEAVDTYTICSKIDPNTILITTYKGASPADDVLRRASFSLLLK
jgi:hypothetical protein